MNLTRPGNPSAPATLAALAAILLVFGLGACSDDGGSSCPEGTEACPCYPNSTCNDGLSCRSDVCVDLSEDDTGVEDTGTTDTGPSDTGAEDTSDDDTGVEDSGTEDSETEDSETEDSGTEDTATDDTGSQDTVTDDTTTDDTGSQDTITDDTGSTDGGDTGDDAGGPCDGQACTDEEYCDWDDNECGRTNSPGSCQTRPRACPRVYDPVCGCDDNTYNNSCFAASAGVDVDYKDPCSS